MFVSECKIKHKHGSFLLHMKDALKAPNINIIFFFQHPCQTVKVTNKQLYCGNTAEMKHRWLLSKWLLFVQPGGLHKYLRLSLSSVRPITGDCQRSEEKLPLASTASDSRVPLNPPNIQTTESQPRSPCALRQMCVCKCVCVSG